MRAAEGRIGRVFILRLEDGDVIPGCIERFAEDKRIRTAHVILLGGVGGGEVVVGPRRSDQMPPEPIFLPVDGAHEVAAVGVLAANEEGRPVLHIHGSLGRAGRTMTGCLRPGVQTWLVAEAILMEIVGAEAVRLKDAKSGLYLLEPGK